MHRARALSRGFVELVPDAPMRSTSSTLRLEGWDVEIDVPHGFSPALDWGRASDSAGSVNQEVRYDQLGRAVGTLFPDGTTAKVLCTPWSSSQPASTNTTSTP